MNNPASTPGKDAYIGRFAPTPSGPLHFGSLVAALASYLDAKAHNGLWLMRIEDIDPPREQPGASDAILQALEAFELFRDGKVMYQSQQNERYQDQVDQLLDQGLAYRCQCSRKQLKGYTVYPNSCRKNPPPTDAECAIRLKTDGSFSIEDRIQGHCQWPMDQVGDFIIQRRDKLFAYQLAVVLDDKEQGINQVVRGYDILESTPRQLQLLKHLNLTPPAYAHIPVIVQANGQKLSKQNLAPAINSKEKHQLLLRALAALQVFPEQEIQACAYSDILHWAVSQWDPSRLAMKQEIPEADLPSST
ncbi:tRNA glutamyl-Q(34) synthetase GluQRS [Oceanospirillum linum]|uniref:Glutamyl-Q tRNA(Asp) synthetase n=1 Tax=Oceanospirillum linum TaxID=966 RepID=A0A1T1H8V0_OCELI|nr:tRNA glutamyl-Q(34) synthetase GluQRS [Oceanospirillum linum]